MTISFPHVLNVSIQKGDIVYAALTHLPTPNGQSGFNQPEATVVDTKPFPIGVVTTVSHGSKSVTIDTTGFTSVTLTSAHYLFFGKDPMANTSGITGYYAQVEYRNYSTKEAEMFATAVDYVESSK